MSSATAIIVPEGLPFHAEWWEGGWKESLAAKHIVHSDPEWDEEIQAFVRPEPVEGCPGCAITNEMFAAIRKAWEDGHITALYALADAYGEQGLVPEQGYDWSGVRDSSPAALAQMYRLTLILDAQKEG